jgi:pentatricopeptide repeat protein
MAEHYAKMENYEQALEYYRKMIVENPTNPDLWQQLEGIYDHLKNYDAAREARDNALLLSTYSNTVNV